MKLSFSTLGCPDFDWVDIYTMAKDFQFDGIEIRGIGRNIHAVTAAPFTPRRINQTIQKLSDLRLTIPCLSSNTALKTRRTAKRPSWKSPNISNWPASWVRPTSACWPTATPNPMAR